MIKVKFPMDVSGALEKEICAWVKEHAQLGDPADHILFEDEELAIYFRLRFGI